MSLKIYHLHFAQSDRIVWLCEELSDLIPNFKYDLHVYPRGMPDSEGKKALLSLHPSGTAPTMVDSTVSPPVTMTESQAILTYILSIHGQGHLTRTPSVGPQAYAQYLYWLNFANGSFQAFLNANLVADTLAAQAQISPETLAQNPTYQHFQQRTKNHLSQYDSRLAESRYLAGDDFSAADIMNTYALTVFRGIYPMDLTEYPNVLRWLKEITSRKAYVRTMEKAEDGLPAMVDAKVPQLGFEVLLSMKSWTTAF